MSTKTYRAICTSKDFKGPWRNTQEAAAQDAFDHQQPNNHVVEIEVSEIVEIRKVINL
jgi:hypothetical protein